MEIVLAVLNYIVNTVFYCQVNIRKDGWRRIARYVGRRGYEWLSKLLDEFFAKWVIYNTYGNGSISSIRLRAIPLAFS
jgi:hypothetical protein